MSVATALLNHSPDELTAVQRQYLRPHGTGEQIPQRLFFEANRYACRMLFRCKATGLENLPSTRPFILAPSHTSSLDPFLIAATLPYSVMSRCRWAAKKSAVLKNPVRQIVNRWAGSVPITRNATALAVGVAVLEQGFHLVWFPEGHRTRDGELQTLRPGIGILAIHTGVPVVPIRILGGYESMPPGTKIPRFGSRIEIRVGSPLVAEDAPAEDIGEQAINRFTDRLYDTIDRLGNP